jgi:hypothetical protein
MPILADAAALTGMLDAYARDPMGGGKPLSAHTRNTSPQNWRSGPMP